MYQHPAAMEMAASYHQEELLREARAHRLAREAEAGHEHHSSAQHRLAAVAVVVLMALAVVAFI